MLDRIYEYWNIFVDLVNRYVIGVIAEMKFVDFVDIVILSVILFYVYRFIRQRRAVRLARGVLIVMAVLFISMIFNMRALNYILENFVQVGMIALIVIFQSDLRAALERFGSTKIKGLREISENDAKSIINTAETIAEAAEVLSKTKTGALIAIERSTKLGEHLSHGVILNAEMSSLLIRNIFFNKAPMHDGAMIVRNKRIYAAGCYLPLSNADVNKDDVAGSANITNLADYVTSIERKFNEDGTDDITKLSILKNRHTGKNVSIELKYDDVRHRFYSSSMMEELNVNYLDDRFQQINIDDSDLPF